MSTFHPIEAMKRPPTYLVFGILTTLLCFLPLGIVSIVYAAQVGSKWAAGDRVGAWDASNKARHWALWSFSIWLTIVLLLTVVSLFGAV